MIELWVKSEGLRRGHDPGHPLITDISAPQEMVFMADRVVIETTSAAWVVKDRDDTDVGMLEPWQLGLKPTPRGYTRVSFDPTRAAPLQIEISDKDMARFDDMRDAMFRR